MHERPKVGVGIAIFNNNKVLLGQRFGAHGEGDWSFPGGHLEFGESFEDCATREVAEEVGVHIDTPKYLGVTNDIFDGVDTGKHYITIYMQAIYISGEPQILEPDRMRDWQWFELNNLPKNLFLPLKNLVKSGVLKG